MKNFDAFFSEDIMRREKQKAREIRKSQWWKRRLAKGECYYCGNPFPAHELTMDHLIPLSLGGKSNKGNLVAACKTCNNNKKNMLAFEWEEYLKKSRS